MVSAFSDFDPEYSFYADSHPGNLLIEGNDSLIAVGAIWTEVRLLPLVEATTYWNTLYGTYVNWFTTGFLSVSVAIISASVLVLWGLRSDRNSKQALWSETDYAKDSARRE